MLLALLTSVSTGLLIGGGGVRRPSGVSSAGAHLLMSSAPASPPSTSTSTGGAMSGKTCGFVGLGIMGEGMAKCLIKSGVNLVVWNRSAAKAEALKAAHPEAVTVVESPAAVLGACEVTFCMLSTPEACQAVYEMPGGVLEGVAPGKCVVDCATLAVADMARMSEQVVGKGGRFLEAPVSGSKGPAAAGALVFLCGGDKPLFEQVSAELEAMGKANFYYGEVGAGSLTLTLALTLTLTPTLTLTLILTSNPNPNPNQVGAGTKMKLVVNMVMGTMMCAFGEGIELCTQQGLQAEQLLEVTLG